MEIEPSKNLRKVLQEMGPMFAEEDEAILLANAEAYDLNPEAVFDWASQTTIDASLLQNIRDGHAEIIHFEDGEPVFRLTESGEVRVKKLLGRTPAGRELLDEIKTERQERDGPLLDDVITVPEDDEL